MGFAMTALHAASQRSQAVFPDRKAGFAKVIICAKRPSPVDGCRQPEADTNMELRAINAAVSNLEGQLPISDHSIGLDRYLFRCIKLNRCKAALLSF